MVLLHPILFIQESTRYKQETGEKFPALDFDQPLNKYKNDPYVLVSYQRTENRLGINPKSSYGTPLGVYGYPVEYVIKTLFVPYGNTRPYTYFFRFKNPERVWILGKTLPEVVASKSEQLGIKPEGIEIIKKLYRTIVGPYPIYSKQKD